MYYGVYKICVVSCKTQLGVFFCNWTITLHSVVGNFSIIIILHFQKWPNLLVNMYCEYWKYKKNIWFVDCTGVKRVPIINHEISFCWNIMVLTQSIYHNKRPQSNGMWIFNQKMTPNGGWSWVLLMLEQKKPQNPY